MSTELSIICSYYDEENREKKYQVFYNNKTHSFRDYDKCGGYIYWINIKDSGDIVVHYSISKSGKSCRTIKKVQSIKIKEEFKKVIRQQELITYATKDIYELNSVAISRKERQYMEDSMSQEVNKLKHMLSKYSIVDSKIKEKYDYIKDMSLSLDDILAFLVRYGEYLNIRKYSMNTEDIIKKYACGGVILLRNGIENINYNVFALKPNLARRVIDELENKDIDTIIKLSKKIFDNKKIDKINNFEEQDIKEILDVKPKNKKRIKKLLTFQSE